VCRHFTAWLISAAVLLALLWAAAWGKASSDPGNEEDEYRTWTDATGEFHVEAALVGFAEGNAQLKKRDGSMISVPAAKLSKPDRSYLQRELARRRRPPQPRVESPADDAPPGDKPPGAAEKPRSAEKPEAAEKPRSRAPAPKAAEPPGGDWPGWRGPKRDGKSPDTGLLESWPPEGPPLLWHGTGIGKGFSSVAVVGGRVYTTGVIGERLVISVFDSEGKRIGQAPHDLAWTKNYPGGRSTPMIDEGNLYLISAHGLVGCYSADSLQKKWSVHMRDFGGSPPEWGYAESVLILGPLAIITPGGSKCIVALNKTNGRPVWVSGGLEAAAQYGSCFAFEFEGVPIVVAGTHGGLAGVDARNGQALFFNPFAAGNTASCPTPIAEAGHVFWAAGYGKGGICMKLVNNRGRLTAEQAWTTGDMVCHHGGYIIHEGHIYGNNDNGWACIELASGATRWKEQAVGKGSLCFADGMLYLFGERGGKAALATCSPEGLEVRGQFSVAGDGPSWAHPVVVGGRLYLRYDDNLYCYSVRAAETPDAAGQPGRPERTSDLDAKRKPTGPRAARLQPGGEGQ